MSESQPTGYPETPDDDAATDDAPDVTLTTDEDSQRDESVARPGND